MGRSLALGVLLMSAASVSAQDHETNAALTVEAPPGCIERDALAAQTAAILGRDPFRAAEGAVDARIDVAITREGEAWRAHLALRDRRDAPLGSRELRRPGEACDVLDGPLAIVVALLVDAAREHVTLDLPPEPVPREESWAVGARASALSSYDLLPEWSLGAALRAELRSPSGWPVVIALTVWPSGGTPGTGPGADLTVFGGGLGTCAPLFVDPRVRVRPCAVLEVGGVRAAGRSAAVVRESIDALASIRATAELEVRLVGPLVLAAAAGVLVALAPPTYVFELGDGVRAIHEPGPVAPWLELGLGIETF